MQIYKQNIKKKRKKEDTVFLAPDVSDNSSH